MKIRCDSCQACTINGHPCHETGCRGFFVFISRGREYAEYKVYSLDVWGNERDGFEVNDRSKIGSILIPVDATDKQIIKALKAKDWLYKRCHTRSFSIDGDSYLLMIDAAKTSEPIYQLERC